MAEDYLVKVSSFRDLLFNTKGGRILLFMGGGLVLMGGCEGLNYLSEIRKNKYSVIQRQEIGDETPDIFIEKDKVKYFSHVDGKEISDLVKEK